MKWEFVFETTRERYVGGGAEKLGLGRGEKDGVSWAERMSLSGVERRQYSHVGLGVWATGKIANR